MTENIEKNNSGLATASMVLGIIAIVLSFIPIINNIAFFIGILAVIFGIICLVKKHAKGKAIAGLVLGALAILITLIMQATTLSAINELANELNETSEEISEELDKMSGNSTEEVLEKEANVTLGELQISQGSYGWIDSKMVVTVKNITNEKKSFSFHIEAVDANGNRIDEDYVYVNDLGAGQSQEFEIFNYIESSKYEAMKAATFKIVEASSY